MWLGALTALCASDDSPCTDTPSQYHTLCVNNESIAVVCATADGGAVSIAVTPHWNPPDARQFLHAVEAGKVAGVSWALAADGVSARFQLPHSAIQDDNFTWPKVATMAASGGRVGMCGGVEDGFGGADSYYVVQEGQALPSAAGCRPPFGSLTAGALAGGGGDDVGVSGGGDGGTLASCSVPSTAVTCRTTKGALVVDVHPWWAPVGAARFLNLVQRGFFTDIALWRVNGAIIQFGANPKHSRDNGRPQLDDIEDVQIADDAHTFAGNPSGPLPTYRLAMAGAPVEARLVEAGETRALPSTH